MRPRRSEIVLGGSLLLTLLTVAAWVWAATVPSPTHVASGDTFWRDGFEWRHHGVVRLRPQRFVVEWWTVPPADDVTFAAEVRMSPILAGVFDGRFFSPVLRDAYSAGPGRVSGKRNRGRPAFAVTGFERVGVSWWFLVLLASTPVWLPPALRVARRLTAQGSAAAPGFPLD